MLSGERVGSLARKSKRPTYADGQTMMFEPDSDWSEPTELPQIPSGATLSVDTETRDNGLSSAKGPGWVFDDGHIAGFSAAWSAGSERGSIYVPLRHPDSSNIDEGQAYRWLQDAVDRSRKIICHNGAYDWGWFRTVDVRPDPDRCDDTQFMGVMIDENRYSYSLDNLCKWRGVPGKDEEQLRVAANAFGVDPKKDLWMLPAKHVGGYGEQDAVATLALYEDLVKEIEAQDLGDAYRLEMDLVPMVLDMRERGIRIDENRAEQAIHDLRRKRNEILDEIGRRLGRSFPLEYVTSPGALELAFDQEQVPYPRTPKTNRGSFKSDWMKNADHWLPTMVTQVRQMTDMSEKFIGNYILGSVHNGRVHAEINQLRDDDSGTRSYRFSYSNPPLQQIPGRDPIFTGIIRGIFLPERGALWGAADYSQQEPRLAVHFAHVCNLAGSVAAVDYYQNRADADFHTMVSELTGVPRKQAKIINLGLMYGMGLNKLAASLGVSLEEAKDIIETYHNRMPFVGALADFCTKRANKRGFIRLLDGARCRFDEWEPAWRERDEPWSPPKPLEEARLEWPGRRLKRCYTHKSMNRLIQGSAARQTKLAMRECYREGLLPMLQMHDELDFSIMEQWQGDRAAEIMRETVKLVVPMKVDMQYGRQWGEASLEAKPGEEALGWEQIRALEVAS